MWIGKVLEDSDAGYDFQFAIHTEWVATVCNSYVGAGSCVIIYYRIVSSREKNSLRVVLIKK